MGGVLRFLIDWHNYPRVYPSAIGRSPGSRLLLRPDPCQQRGAPKKHGASHARNGQGAGARKAAHAIGRQAEIGSRLREPQNIRRALDRGRHTAQIRSHGLFRLRPCRAASWRFGNDLYACLSHGGNRLLIARAFEQAVGAHCRRKEEGVEEDLVELALPNILSVGVQVLYHVASPHNRRLSELAASAISGAGCPQRARPATAHAQQWFRFAVAPGRCS